MQMVQVKDWGFCYPGCEAPALSHVDFTIEEGAFVLLCGASGSGKSTLLSHLKREMAPHGTQMGAIEWQGSPLSAMSEKDSAQRIGYVAQTPETQIVTDTVWHELAFGLESLGYDTPTIRRRVAEMASFFGIQTWFYKNVTELSGGQKQLLNLASIMAMQPSVLILDEPTSQLDPIAAADFLATLGKINRELGTPSCWPAVWRSWTAGGCSAQGVPRRWGRSCAGRDTQCSWPCQPRCGSGHPRRMRADTARSRCGRAGIG